MNPRSQATSLVAERLRAAYLRHGLDTSQPSFASEFRSVFGAEIEHLDEFFNRNGDLPLSDVFRLCEAVKVPASEILNTAADQEHLQIYDYLGGASVNVFLPPGLMWDRASVDSLFYYPLGDKHVQGFTKGDFLVFTRITLAPTVGRVYLLESNEAVSVRYCVPTASADTIGFSAQPEDKSGDMIELPKQTLSGDASNGFAAVTGALVWRISSGKPPAARIT
jgi:hypothetical protein